MSNISTTDDPAKKHLLVLSTCAHVYCHGCVLNHQLALAEDNHGVVPDKIPCMNCRAADVFCPSRPQYDIQLIEFCD